MGKLILTAVFIVTMVTAASAQTGFNPGTVITNTYQNAAVARGGFGLDQSPLSYRDYWYAPGYADDAPAQHIQRRVRRPVHNQ